LKNTLEPQRASRDRDVSTGVRCTQGASRSAVLAISALSGAPAGRPAFVAIAFKGQLLNFGLQLSIFHRTESAYAKDRRRAVLRKGLSSDNEVDSFVSVDDKL